MDAARGFALLGIFLVNIEFFSRPLGAAMAPPEAGSSALAMVLWALVAVFCEGKFYPLFSLLFGMGLILHRASVERSRQAFVPLYLRRIAVLGMIGLFHALVLWYGDILFVYACVALVLLVGSASRPSSLAGIGLASIAFGVALSSLALVATELASPAVAESTEISEQVRAEIEERPWGALMKAWQEEGARGADDPGGALWLAAETVAFRDGAWTDALRFRSLNFLLMMTGQVFGGGFHVLGLFFLGAALIKGGLFEQRGRLWLRRFLWLGLCVGAPLCGVGVLVRFQSESWGLLVWSVLTQLGGPLLSLAYLSVFALLARHRSVEVVVRLFAAPGRLALTNYLSQTLIATFVMYHWGLGFFGSLDVVERVVLVMVVYTIQLVLSHAWLRRYRYGPMEWLWRSLTYGRALEWRRASG